jgi:hypothetical protein
MGNRLEYSPPAPGGGQWRKEGIWDGLLLKTTPFSPSENVPKFASKKEKGQGLSKRTCLKDFPFSTALGFRISTSCPSIHRGREYSTESLWTG